MNKDKKYFCCSCNKEISWRGYSYNHKYCNNECQMNLRRSEAKLRKEQEVKDWVNGKTFTYKNFRGLVKKYLIEKFGNKCSCCGIDSWNGKSITLWVDHIDGDATNNRPENFRLICPNCDSQSDTFGAKNYGKGRKARGLPQYG